MARPGADYGSGLIPHLAKELTLRHGRMFRRGNLKVMRQFDASWDGRW
ncbi:DUF1016 domain-containing protein [Aquisphaera insulae]|nr:DUF1016 domain-containing protein [Aquisphaera insulae]